MDITLEHAKTLCGRTAQSDLHVFCARRFRIGPALRENKPVLTVRHQHDIAFYDWIRSHLTFDMAECEIILDAVRPYIDLAAKTEGERQTTNEDFLEIVDMRYLRGLNLGMQLYDLEDLVICDTLTTAGITIVGCNMVRLMDRWNAKLQASAQYARSENACERRG